MPWPPSVLAPRARTQAWFQADFQRPVGLARPVAGVRVFASVPRLHRPRHGKSGVAVAAAPSWVTIGFMGRDHVLALVALLPRFWSVPAVVSCGALLDHGLPGGPRWAYHGLPAPLLSGCPTGWERFFAHLRRPELPARSDRLEAACTAIPSSPNTGCGSPTNSHAASGGATFGWMFQTIPATAAVPRLTGDLAARPPTTAG